jgi:HAD superfamily hydrolase (TIGR01458 family)
LGSAVVQAVVLDMEGVLHVDYQPLDGAPDAVERLRSAGLELAILTNTTGRSRASIAERLEQMGMSFPAERIVTAAHATALHVRSAHPGAAVYLLGEQGAASEFDGVRLVEDPAEADVVVVAGPSREVDYPLLNRVFRALVDCRPLIAMQRNRWWPTSRGPAMDAGGLVAALEYSADVRAEVVGKPSETIYRIALETMAATPDAAIMVGDDLVSDLRPAAAIGMRTGLVRTGKGASMTPEPGELTYDEADLARLADRLLS